MIAAFLDANVLYSATLRSVLLELARSKAFRILWPEQVHQEWMQALKRWHPQIPEGRIARMRSLMEAYVALPLRMRTSASHTLIDDNHKSALRCAKAARTFGLRRAGSVRLQIQMWVPGRRRIQRNASHSP